MGVAIISAAGVLAAAILTIVVSLITTNERSARLLREAEALSKLEAGTRAHRLMEARLEASIVRYGLEADSKWNHGDHLKSSLAGLFIAFLLAVWGYVGERFDIHSWQFLYYFVLVQMLGWGAVCTYISTEETVARVRSRRKSKRLEITEKD